MLCSVTAVVSDSWRARGLQPARPLCLWDSPGKNTGVGCHFLLQGIFLTQGSIKPVSRVSPALAAKFFTTSVTWAAQEVHTFYFILFYSIHGSLRKLKKKKKTGEDGRGNPFLSTGDRNTNKMVYSWGLPGGPVVKTSLPMQGVPVQSLVGELRPHLPCGQKTKP